MAPGASPVYRRCDRYPGERATASASDLTFRPGPLRRWIRPLGRARRRRRRAGAATAACADPDGSGGARSPRGRRRLGLGGRDLELDRGHVAPQLLEAVEAPGVGGEEVEDDVEVVRDDPRRLGRAGGGPWQQIVLPLQDAGDLV